jgi:hypothetical protein
VNFHEQTLHPKASLKENPPSAERLFLAADHWAKSPSQGKLRERVPLQENLFVGDVSPSLTGYVKYRTGKCNFYMIFAGLIVMYHESLGC